MKNKLGTLQRVDPREVWQNEAHHFTPWLAAHIDALSEALGMELEIVEREAEVGDFSLDLLARDLGRDRAVVIENQLGVTDHSHLGQLITYAAGLDASAVIWIAREFREEHRQALDWLNHSSEVEFFGVILELLRVDDSRPAVNFRLVAKPNAWSRQSKRAEKVQELSGKSADYQTFFQALIDDLREGHRFTNAKAGQPQNWYSFSSGVRGFKYSASFAQGGRVRAELYIDIGKRALNEATFETLLQEREFIESEFGEALEWEPLDSRRACRIACYRNGSIEDDTAELDEHRRWVIDRLLRFREVFGPRLTALARSRSA